MTPEQQKALDEYLAGLKEYGSYQPQTYKPEIISTTGYENLQYDPAMRQYEMAALQALEQQGKEGFTAQDRAALAATEQDVNRQNQGRMGAIQQSMQRRGLANSGMNLAAQLQSAQAANEIAAMRALETGSQAAQRMSQGRLGAAQLAGNIGQRDYQTAAQKAQAQSDINRFNALNRMEAQKFGITQAQEQADRQLKAKTGGAQMQYNAATERERARLMREEEDRRRRSGLGGAVLGAAGAGLGAYFGGPAGAGAGYSVGSGLGQAMGFANGGRVPEYNLGLNPPQITDTVPAMLTPGEMVLPQGVADSPSAAAQFVADQKKAEENLASAQNMQDYLGYADIVGKGLSDYSKSQARNVYLPSRFEEIGKGPDVYQSQMAEFKPGSISALGEQGVSRAKEGLQDTRQKFADALTMEKMNPNSQQAQAAQLLLTSAINNKIKEANNFQDKETAKSLKQFVDTGVSTLSPSEALQMQQIIKGIDYADTLKLLTAKQQKPITTQVSQPTPSAQIGKPVSGELGAKLAGYDAAKTLVQQMSSNWDEKASSTGSGILSMIPGISNDPKLYEQSLAPYIQQIGGFLEGGKLTDDDFRRYTKMMPSATDTQAQKENKIKSLMQAIQTKQEAELSGLQSLGYRVPGQSSAPVKGSSTLIDQEQDL